MRALSATLAVLMITAAAPAAMAERTPPLPVTCREDQCWGPSTRAHARRAIAHARELLLRGESRDVVYSIDEMYVEDDALENQLDLLAAVGALRSGLHQVRTQNPAKTIRLAYEDAPHDPELQTWYAEALLRGLYRGTLATPAEARRRAADALRLLTALDDKGQLTGAHGLAALARAQREAGKGAAAKATVKRCEAVAPSKGICAWALKK